MWGAERSCPKVPHFNPFYPTPVKPRPVKKCIILFTNSSQRLAGKKSAVKKIGAFQLRRDSRRTGRMSFVAPARCAFLDGEDAPVTIAAGNLAAINQIYFSARSGG